jgi:hypothetical protein
MYSAVLIQGKSDIFVEKADLFPHCSISCTCTFNILWRFRYLMLFFFSRWNSWTLDGVREQCHFGSEGSQRFWQGIKFSPATSNFYLLNHCILKFCTCKCYEPASALTRSNKQLLKIVATVMITCTGTGVVVVTSQFNYSFCHSSQCRQSNTTSVPN